MWSRIKSVLGVIARPVTYFAERLLLLATKRNWSGVVTRLINLGVNVNCTECGGNTPLWYAINNHKANKESPAQAQIVADLIAAGANVNLTYEKERTALYRAVELVDLKSVKVLLANGAKETVNAPHAGGYTPLLICAEKLENEVHLKILQALLHAGAAANPAVTKASRKILTPLQMLAAKLKGAESADAGGIPVLSSQIMYACIVQACKSLLFYGANPTDLPQKIYRNVISRDASILVQHKKSCKIQEGTRVYGSFTAVVELREKIQRILREVVNIATNLDAVINPAALECRDMQLHARILDVVACKKALLMRTKDLRGILYLQQNFQRLCAATNEAARLEQAAMLATSTEKDPADLVKHVERLRTTVTSRQAVLARAGA